MDMNYFYLLYLIIVVYLLLGFKIYKDPHSSIKLVLIQTKFFQFQYLIIIEKIDVSKEGEYYLVISYNNSSRYILVSDIEQERFVAKYFSSKKITKLLVE